MGSDNQPSSRLSNTMSSDYPWDLVSVYLDELSDVCSCLLSEKLGLKTETAVASILSVVDQLQQMVSKFTEVFQQICLLNKKCRRVCCQLEAITVGGNLENYYRVWKSLQVYEGLHCVLSVKLVKLATKICRVSDVISRHHTPSQHARLPPSTVFCLIPSTHPYSLYFGVKWLTTNTSTCERC